MAYPVRAYRTTPTSPKTAPDRTRRAAPGDRRRPIRDPGRPSELGKPLPPGGGSNPSDFGKPPPRPPGGGGGFNPGKFLFGRNPWIQGFKWGWWLGDRIGDAIGLPPLEFTWHRLRGAQPPSGLTLECSTGNGYGLYKEFAWNCGFNVNMIGNLPVATWPTGLTALDRVVAFTHVSGTIYRAEARWQVPIGPVPASRPAIWVRVPKLKRYVHPMAVPPGHPRPDPVPPPWGQPDPAPEGREGGQPPGPPPPTTGDVVIRFQPGRPAKVVVVPRQPPDGKTKEKKLRMSKGAAIVIRAINGLTELLDAVDALYGAINEGPCKDRFKPANGQNKATTAKQRAAAVYSCFGSIDWDTAVFNFVWQDIEDRVWAKLGLPTKEFGRSYGTNLGVNRLLSDAFGDNVADTLGGAEDWIKPRIAARLGVTLN